MKEKVNPLMLIIAGVAVAVVIGILVWKTNKATPGDAGAVIVKPANPDDPKYRPDPRLGLAGGGGR